jgi:membrane-associated phospholipid phosphatase
VAASVTALTLVIVLVEPGHRRRVWWTWSIVFMLLMAVSRAYLRAHWLSDGVEGVLLGSACAVDAAILMQAMRNARMRRRGVPHPEERAEAPGPLQADAMQDDRARTKRPSRPD